MSRVLDRLALALAGRNRSRCAPSKLVAIVVPLSARATLTPDEAVSMRHLLRFLGHYDKYLVAPAGLDVHFEGFRVKRFAPTFFGSMRAHNFLWYAPAFFKSFEDYKYILVYHLDALVFSDQLREWCEAGWDYIGAPWIRSPETPWVQEPRVGNGGFCLINTHIALEVLYRRFRAQPARYWDDLLTRNAPKLEPLRKLKRLVVGTRVAEQATQRWRQALTSEAYRRGADMWWSFEAEKLYPEFKLAPVEAGLRFAFEVAPRVCFVMNQCRMPFGCHAWSRYDRSFWEPHLLR